MKTMCEFVKRQLEQCGLSHLVHVFEDHEIDEEEFRDLSYEDIKYMFPGNLEVQERILTLLRTLLREQLEEQEVHDYEITPDDTSASSQDDDEEEKEEEDGQLLNYDKSDNSSMSESKGEDSDSDSSLTSNSCSSEIPAKTSDIYNSNNSNNETVNSESLPISNPKKRKQVPDHIIKVKENLPVYRYKSEIIQIMKLNQVLILVGETGSGKSTQIVQYLLEAGFGNDDGIVCTQPRRIAARSLATRVCEELGVELGEEVGYQVRFENVTSSTTRISYVTDGLLLQFLANSPKIDRFKAIILDEAHERLLNTDILLGLLKSTLSQRPDLKLIISSATINAEKFSRFFNNAPVLNIPGKYFNVERIYVKDPFPVGNYVLKAIKTVLTISKQEKPGDILVFLSGVDEIYRCIYGLQSDQSLHCLPCYANLPDEQQNLVFEPAPIGMRKVIVATNIAETSLTIDGIVYVVDSGQVKTSYYTPQEKLSFLETEMITRDRAEQRAGRAGRTKDGKVFRLYSESIFNRMKPNIIPEIHRGNLDSILLKMAAFGVNMNNIYDFKFIDPPSPDRIKISLAMLQKLGALSSSSSSALEITRVGRQMSRFPLDPRLSRVLMESVRLKCIDYILTIVSILSVLSSNEQIFERPIQINNNNSNNNKNSKTSREIEEEKKIMEKKKAEFFDRSGDHLTFLGIFNSWIKFWEDCDKDEEATSQWCKENFIVEKTLIMAMEIRDQLWSIIKSNYPRKCLEKESDMDHSHEDFVEVMKLRMNKCFAAGYADQIAEKSPQGHGYTVDGGDEEVFIHPASSLFLIKPEYIFYEQMRKNGKEKKTLLINCLEVDRRALFDVGDGIDWIELERVSNLNQNQSHHNNVKTQKESTSTREILLQPPFYSCSSSFEPFCIIVLLFAFFLYFLPDFRLRV